MKKAMLFSFTRNYDNSLIASIRIARYVGERLDLPVIDDRTIAEYDGVKLDVLYIINGAFAFCRCLPALAAHIETARRVIWIQNDYTIIPPKADSAAESPFRRAFRVRGERGLPPTDFWTTCDDWAHKTPRSVYVNWNMLTFDPTYSARTVNARRKKAGADLFYYGSFRNASGKSSSKSSRLRYFDRYFKEPFVPTTISSAGNQSTQHREDKQFRGSYKHPKITHVGPMISDFYSELGSHGLGLYIEDRMSHEHFHSPANRFYEMLSAGLPMVFQPEAESMMRRAGYDVSPFLVYSAKSIATMIDKREAVGVEQRRLWVADPARFRTELDQQLEKAIKS